MFVRDTITQAVINSDDSHYRAILAQREARRKAEDLQRNLEALQSEMSEIKVLLQKVINGKNYG